jgi:hypothetical protein
MEFALDFHLTKPERLQNRALRTTGKFLRNTLIRDMHMTFQIPYLYDYMTKFCRQQARIIQNYDHLYNGNTGQGQAPYRKYKKLKLGDNQVYDRSNGSTAILVRAAFHMA